jgi:hypothetical protein
MSHPEPRASIIIETLRSMFVETLEASGANHSSWERLDDQLAGLADELAVAVDDRAAFCRACGRAATVPPLDTLAALLRPTTPRGPLSTDLDKVLRLQPVLLALASLQGQCDEHDLLSTILGSTSTAHV